MPNGKPGDNPVTDIVLYGRTPFSSDVNELIREIDSFTDDYGSYDPFDGLEDLLFAAEDDRSREPKLRDALLARRAHLIEKA